MPRQLLANMHLGAEQISHCLLHAEGAYLSPATLCSRNIPSGCNVQTAEGSIWLPICLVLQRGHNDWNAAEHLQLQRHRHWLQALCILEMFQIVDALCHLGIRLGRIKARWSVAPWQTDV